MNVKALSGADVARCFGVDRSMVTRWKKAGMPENKGVFSLPECIKWRLEREAEAMAPKEGTSTEGEKWLTAFRRERARIARLERLERQKKLIPQETILPEWVKRVSEIRQGLLSLSSKMPPLLEGRDTDAMRSIIKKAVYALLTAYSRGGPFTPVSEEIEKILSEAKQ